MYLIDTHTHVYDHQFSLDRNEAVQRALDAGVKMMLLPNVDASTIAPMLELYEQYPDCTRVMMGLQPEEVKEDYKEVLSMMEKELGEARPASRVSQSRVSQSRVQYVGVGEVGLDFYWDATYEKQQLDAFETQLDWAKQLRLPLSIHCRNAFDKMVKILEKKQDGGLHGIMHCFTGTEEEAKPYLAPVPCRGKRNEPAFLVHTAQKIADVLQIPVEELAEATTKNVQSLFAGL